jgi:hypothetical protein
MKCNEKEEEKHHYMHGRLIALEGAHPMVCTDICGVIKFRGQCYDRYYCRFSPIISELNVDFLALIIFFLICDLSEDRQYVSPIFWRKYFHYIT